MRSFRWLAAACVLVLAACNGDSTGEKRPGPPASIARPAGDGQTAPVASGLPTPLMVRVTDADGKPTPNITVDWAVTAGGGSVVPAGTLTNADGVATTVWTLGPQAGPQGVSATVAGLAPAAFTATASPGPPTQITVVSGADQVAIAGTTFSRDLRLRVADAHGNAIPNQAVTLSVDAALGTLTGGSATTSADGTVNTRVTVFPAAQRAARLRVTAMVGLATRTVDFYVRRPVLVYTRFGAEQTRIHELDWLSETTRVLSPAGEDAYSAALSPDGSLLAYGRYNGTTGFVELVVMNLGTGEQRVVYAPSDRDAFLPSFSPDGETLAFTTYLYNDEGQILQSRIGTFNLRTGALQSNALSSNLVEDADFGPDGRIVYSSVAAETSELYVRNLATGATTRATNDPTVVNLEPTWLNATRLVYTCYANALPFTYDICSVNADGTERRVPNADPDWHDFGPSISYDRVHIAFSSFPDAQAGDIDIYKSLTAGGNVPETIPGTTTDDEMYAHFGLVGWEPAGSKPALSRLPLASPARTPMPGAVRARLQAASRPKVQPSAGPVRPRRTTRALF